MTPTTLNDPEPEIMAGIRAPDAAQALLAGTPVRNLGLVEVGYYGPGQFYLAGWFALVDQDGPHADLVGDILLVRRRDAARYVYVLGARDLPQPICLYRRPFMDLAPLAFESVLCVVEVCG